MSFRSRGRTYTRSRERWLSGVDSKNGATEKDEAQRFPDRDALERDQTLADEDQTLADADQSSADSDQTAADSDQVAADNDQEASDRDLAGGGDPALHDRTRHLREHGSHQRREAAKARAEAAAARDAVAHARDLAASARDQAAALHDRELAVRDAAWAARGRADLQLRAAENRERAAADRAAAAEGRARAAADREQARRDREQAARDRLEAQADREELLHQLAMTETDALTGARARSAGLEDLDREIDRARRTTGALAIAYVDVVGLKATNDERGHAAGDALLRRVVHAIRSQLRSYDSIARLGGDEFLCVISGATVDDVRERFGAVQAALGADPYPCRIKVGLAALAQDDDAARLIGRADENMPTSPARSG
jgi:diguanylate cyclase (GGDEF)-like protein